MAQLRRVARAAVPTAAAAACLVLATPAWANSTVPLHQSNVTAAQAEQDCSGPLGHLTAGQDGWHFVLPGQAGGDFLSLSLTFSHNGSTETVTIPDTADAYPDSFGTANGRVIHAYLVTPAGWTLVSGSASITGTAPFFNLSHACAGSTTPTTPTTPPGTPTTPPATPTTAPPTTPGTPGAPGGVGGGTSGSLPVTGAAAATTALAGTALIGGGAALLVLRRRRKITFIS